MDLIFNSLDLSDRIDLPVIRRLRIGESFLDGF